MVAWGASEDGASVRAHDRLPPRPSLPYAPIALCVLLLWASASPGNESSPIVLVRGTATEDQDPEGEGPAAARACALVGSALHRAGIPHRVVGDDDVAAGALADVRVAIFPYNPRLAEGERESLLAYADAGGKIMSFYTLDPKLRRALGIEACELRARSRPGEFAEMRFTARAPSLAPRSLYQNSWIVVDVHPADDGQVLAVWHDSAGRPTPRPDATGTPTPAVVLGPSGIFVSHIMLGPVTDAKCLLMLSAVSHLAGPFALEPAAEARLRLAQALSAWEGLGGLREFARAIEDPRADRAALLEAIDEAARAERRAISALEVGAYAEALKQAMTAEHKARETVALALPSRDGEIRAVWVRFPERVDWRSTAPRLAKAGINVVLPNYVRGVSAAYETDALTGRDAPSPGGELSTCITECRRVGMETHVWWSVLFLDDTPPAVIDKLSGEKRLIVLADGSELRPAGSAWLCPSSEANVMLLAAAAKELVERYSPDGIHLDYIRMPSERTCYCHACRDAFGPTQKWPDDVLPGAPRAEEYRDRRRGFVSGIVTTIVTAARRVRPDVFFSAAVYPEPAICRQTIAQDWVDWARRGLLDFVVPMNYTNRPDDLARWVHDQSQRLAGRIPLVTGLGVAAGRVGIDDPGELIRQIAVGRASGADGFAIFQLDGEFLAKHLPAIAAGPGRTGSGVRPHGAPQVRWELPAGLDPEQVPSGRTVELVVGVGNRLASGLGAISFGLARGEGPVWPRVELESASGRLLADLGPGPAPGRQVRVPFVAPVGDFRIAVRGRVTAPPRGTRLVAVRSPVMRGVTQSDIEAERARTSPSGSGPRVAVLDGGYGSRGILAWLRRRGTFAAYPIASLGELADPQRRPRVLVLTQRRDPAELDGAARAALRLFVEAGGSVLLTHDACGYRYHPALFGDVARGVGHERSSRVTITADSVLRSDGENGDDTVEHAHYDHVLLQPGDGASVLARGEGGPVVVGGEQGRGRVVACGIAIGIDRDEREHAPARGESELVRRIVKYLIGDAADREER